MTEEADELRRAAKKVIPKDMLDGFERILRASPERAARTLQKWQQRKNEQATQ